MTTKKQREAKLKAIAACKDRHGRILPKLVVEAARNPRSPLHNEFEWDDKKAGALYRLSRAQELIREVKAYRVFDDVRYAVPHYVSDPSSKESAYIPITVAERDESIAETVLLDELRRIESAVMRARGMAAAFDAVHHFDRMLSDLLEVRGRVLKRRGGEAGDEARA